MRTHTHTQLVVQIEKLQAELSAAAKLQQDTSEELREVQRQRERLERRYAHCQQNLDFAISR